MSLVASFSQDSDSMEASSLGQDVEISALTPDGFGFFHTIKPTAGQLIM